MLLSSIQGLSLLLNIILILSATKKASKPSLCSRLKICLNGFNASVCFQNYLTYYFFSSQESFPKSGKISLIKEFFHSQGNFPQKIFYLIKKSFPKQRPFPQSGKFSIKKIQQRRKFSTKIFTQSKKIFYKWRSKRFSKS